MLDVFVIIFSCYFQCAAHYCFCLSIVEFATYGDMKNAITKLDDTEINGRRIRIIEQKTRGRRHRSVLLTLSVYTL